MPILESYLLSNTIYMETTIISQFFFLFFYLGLDVYTANYRKTHLRFSKSKAIINFIEFIEISLYLKATTYINDENV